MDVPKKMSGNQSSDVFPLSKTMDEGTRPQGSQAGTQVSYLTVSPSLDVNIAIGVGSPLLRAS